MSTSGLIGFCPYCSSKPCCCRGIVASRLVPHKCPVCEGCGTVPMDFYSQLGVSTSTGREPCRACTGYGLVWA